MEPLGTNPLAQVRSGQLLLSAYTLPLLRSTQYANRNGEIFKKWKIDKVDFDQPIRYETEGMRPAERLVGWKNASGSPAALVAHVPYGVQNIPLLFEIEEDMIFSRECLLLLVTFPASMEDPAGRMGVGSLVVSLVDGFTDSYEWVGVADFSISNIDEEGFSTDKIEPEAWLRDWGWVRQTVEII